MNKLQWNVMGILFLVGSLVFNLYYAEVSEIHTGLNIDYSQSIIFEVLGVFCLFLMIVCVIMGLLEPKQKK